MTVVVEPDETAREIREFLRANPGLRDSQIHPDDPEHSVYGHCYPAAEAYFHARGGTDSVLDIYCLSWSDVRENGSGTHWYLRDPDVETWIDLAIEQPDDGDHIPFSEGRRRAFITGYEPSKRARRILEAIGEVYA